MARKKIDWEATILRVLEEKREADVHRVAQAAGKRELDMADRRAIQRAFKALIERKRIRAQGNARARVYLLALEPAKGAPEKEMGGEFKSIPLSRSSQELLRYINQPKRSRTPAGYDQDFLRSYQPNRTSYLSSEQRTTLESFGKVEPVSRAAGTYARNIFNRLLIDLSWNSSRLEGNTYSLLETQRLLQQGESAIGKDAAEAQMILNHKGAIEYILDCAEDPEITGHTVCSVHALLSENLLGDPGASGRLRQTAVGVGGSTYLPLDNPHVLRESFDLFIEKTNQILDPFEQSFFSLVHLSYMQAFEDVNKRTARIVANIPLVKKNLKPLSFTDVPQEAYLKALLGVYEKTDVSLFRDLFLWAYERSSRQYSAIQQSMGEPNLLKLKHRNAIQEIVREIVLGKVAGREIVGKIQSLLGARELPEPETRQLFQVIETEIMSLHDGNIARFKIRPSEFKDWKALQ